MKYRVIIHLVSILAAFLGIGMLLSALVSFSMEDSSRVVSSLLKCGFCVIGAGAAGYWNTRRKKGEPEFRTGKKEGYATVAMAWLLSTLVCAAPFFFAANMELPDAIFEAASGLTTTGASVVSESTVLRSGAVLVEGIEGLPKGILFWRSMLNLFGGIGIVFFVLLIMPVMKLVQGKQLYNAEVPGMKTDSDQLTPRLLSSVKLMVCIYLFLGAMAASCYALLGMNMFDAICHAFATISTGGFSTRNASAGYYQSPVIQWTMIVFMFISACNFSLIIKFFITRRLSFWRDEEFRFFFFMVLSSSLFTAVMLYINNPVSIHGMSAEIPRSVEAYLRAAVFQVTSVATTTGFGTSDYTQWNLPVVLMVFMLIMFPCGCGGSTSGGIKCSRIIVLLKQLAQEIKHCIFPRTLPDIRINGERIEQAVVEKNLTFIFLYILTFMLFAILVAFTEGRADPMTAAGASLSCISNIGPGFGMVGPAASFGWMCGISKLLLSLEMIAGRLELYTIIVLFMPSLWKK